MSCWSPSWVVQKRFSLTICLLLAYIYIYTRTNDWIVQLRDSLSQPLRNSELNEFVIKYAIVGCMWLSSSLYTHYMLRILAGAVFICICVGNLKKIHNTSAPTLETHQWDIRWVAKNLAILAILGVLCCGANDRRRWNWIENYLI